MMVDKKTKIRIDNVLYKVDDDTLKVIKRVRTRIQNMKATIKEYTERIKKKESYLNDIYEKVKK